ncbi:hypothetical protein AB0F18_03040 [Streptomyces sp. NPDC029216]|uniref:hypothetical protein n=1 Tax=Streptomyces sp. NPDC029216 TaxID=3154701 RepID=UPI0033E334C0
MDATAAQHPRLKEIAPAGSAFAFHSARSRNSLRCASAAEFLDPCRIKEGSE